VADAIRIEIKGIPQLQAKFKQIDNDMQKALLEGLVEGGALVVNTAKGRVAYKTGNLKNNIKEQKQSMSGGKAQVDVGVTTVPYAARIEFGYTGPDKLGRRFHQKPRPYLRNSLDEKEREIKTAVETKIKSVLRRYA